MWIRNVRELDHPQALWDMRIEKGLIAQLRRIKSHPTRQGFDASAYWVTPGFANAHTHVAMSHMKSLAPQAPNLIRKWMFPIESKLTEEDVYIFSKLGIAECLLGGSTTIFDHYYFPHAIAQAAKDLGIRAVIAPTIVSTEGPFSFDTLFTESKSFFAAKHTPNIIPMAGPHATDTLDDKRFKLVIDLAKAENLSIHLHIAQTHREFTTVLKKHRCTPVALLHRLRCFDQPTLLAHAIYLKSSDFRYLKHKNVVVAICPSSLAQFDKLPPLLEFEKRNVTYAIGTDADICNDTMDMGKELRSLLLFQRIIQNSATPPYQPQPKKILMASRTPALKLLRKPHLQGKIAQGQAADLLFIRKDSPHLTPLFDATWSQVMNVHPEDIQHVMVGGQWVIKNRTLVRDNWTEIRDKALNHSRRLLKRAGITKISW